MSYTITLRNIRIISNHGCLDEEAAIGSEYIMDIVVHADLSKSTASDDLKDTIDYVYIHKVAEKHCLNRKKLLEPVIKNICEEILESNPTARKVWGELRKINPPIGGDVEYVAIAYEVSR